ncbi:MAG TPA: hypothetical protein VFJ82_18690 [Longimicrobium sp.]|nr:hypothetical protein [Longimicrobium sp.]
MERLSLRYGAPPHAAALTELPRGVAEPVHEVLNLLWLFGTVAGARHADRIWFSAAEVQALEESLLTSGLDEAIRSPLAVIVGTLARPPRRTKPLAQACAAAAEWALEVGARETASAFLELAALCKPNSARLALMAGRTLKNNGKLREAEYWLRRAAKLAQWSRDWKTLVLSQNSLGILWWNQGAIARAERHLFRGLRFARKYHLKLETAMANHEIFVVRVTSQQFEGAEAFAQAALEHYPPDDHRLAPLSYDLAYYWLMRGYVRRAEPLLEGLLPRFPDPPHRTQVLSALARAAGATGNRALFDQAWRDALPLVEHPSGANVRAAVLIDLGLGARSFRLWSEAESCFSRAARSAEDLSQHDMLIRAQTLLKMPR